MKQEDVMARKREVWVPDLGNGRYRNPVIHADYSDPDIVRVGDDFFMVASSFCHMPALPLLHSRDLVNWRIVNHVCERLDLPGYDRVQHGKGVWAPSIRYHAGRFWVFFPLPDEGIFMSQTEDPFGAWSTPHCLKQAKGWIDPCPLWDDDGTAWLVHGFAFSRSGIKHKLNLCRMSTDGTRLLDEGRIIYDGTVDQPTLEGPKFYKRNGYYYIFAPAGGVATGWQTVLRSRSVEGPYEARVVLSRGDTPVNGPHQGGYVELANGESWFVHFQDAHVYGRIVHLQPMRWIDDWPQIGELLPGSNVGQPVASHAGPGLPEAGQIFATPQTSDDFSGDRLGLQWQWQANPRPEWMSLDGQALTLQCMPSPRRDGQSFLYDAPNLLMQKFPARQFVVTTRMSASLQQPGEQAGLVVFGERYASLALRRCEHKLELVYRMGWMNDQQTVTEMDVEVHEPTRCDMFWLRVEVDAEANCRFSWSLDGQTFVCVRRSFGAWPGKWVGAKVGVFAVAQDVPDGVHGTARFSDFEVCRA